MRRRVTPNPRHLIKKPPSFTNGAILFDLDPHHLRVITVFCLHVGTVHSLLNPSGGAVDYGLALVRLAEPHTDRGE